MDDRFDDEMHALLSAYAAGTLTPEEQKRLFEKSLSNQKLFDALADEESMRAALASPLVKQSLTRALEQMDQLHDQLHASGAARARPPIAKLLWAAVASCLLVGIVSVTLWPTKPVVQIAEVQKQVMIAANIPVPKPAQKQISATPQPSRERLADKAPAAPAIAFELEAKKEAPAEKDSVKSRADAAPPAPKPSIAVSADSTRLETAMSSQSGGFNIAAGQLGAAANSIAKAAPPMAAIERNNLAVNAAAASHVYAFLIDGDTIKPLSPTAEATRLFPLGIHSAQAEVWLLVTPTPDPVLERALTGVLPLPTRNWIKLKTNP